MMSLMLSRQGVNCAGYFLLACHKQIYLGKMTSTKGPPTSDYFVGTSLGIYFLYKCGQCHN